MTDLQAKRMHYGNIHENQMSNLTIAVRILDKARRLVRLEYLNQVKKDLWMIEEVDKVIGDIDAIQEDTVEDLSNYLTLYIEGVEIESNKESKCKVTK